MSKLVCDVCWERNCKSVCGQDFEQAKIKIQSLESKLTQELKKVKKYEKALDFYANPWNWSVLIKSNGEKYTAVKAKGKWLTALEALK